MTAMRMAGGGVRGGQVIGATDAVSLHAVEDRLHLHDLHATIHPERGGGVPPDHRRLNGETFDGPGRSDHSPIE
jgi:hypothetical protein